TMSARAGSQPASRPQSAQQQLPPLLTQPTSAGFAAHRQQRGGSKRCQHQAVQTEANGPDDLQSLIGFVLEECRRECLDRRRVFMLKCQIVQLERQLLLMSDSIGQRRESTVALADRLAELTQLCQAAIGSEAARGSPNVSVSRADLMRLTQEASRLRHSLTKQADSAINDLHHQSFLIPNAFLRCGSVTLKEVAESARGLAFLNLAKVGQLEADLADLHGRLSGLQPLLAAARPLPIAGGRAEAALTAGLIAAESRIEAAGAQLMELSLLAPCLQQRRPLPELGAGLLEAASGPAIARHLADCRTAESRAALEAALKALRSRLSAVDAERVALRRSIDELSTNQRKLDDFLASTLAGLRAGARQFGAHARNSLAPPLDRVLAAHDRLLRHPSEACRDAFLRVCRDDLPLARAALDACRLPPPSQDDGEAEDTVQERRIREAFDAAMRDDWLQRAEAARDTETEDEAAGDPDGDKW
ncbi:hypothetical protein BOX15_Mlig012977g3, partial [Macrostomum lignano]